MRDNSGDIYVFAKINDVCVSVGLATIVSLAAMGLPITGLHILPFREYCHVSCVISCIECLGTCI